jgi:glycosidase
VLQLYRRLLKLRRGEPALRRPDREGLQVVELSEGALAMRRDGEDGPSLLVVVNFRGEVRVELDARLATRSPEGQLWYPLLASEEIHFGGTGAWGRYEPSEGEVHMIGPGAVVLRSG